MPGPTTISRGNILNSLTIQVTLAPVAVAGNSTIEQSFTIPGLVAGDQISAVQFLGAVANQDISIVNSRVGAANTLTIAFQNGSGGALTPTAGNYYIEINRIENLPPPANLV